MDPQRITRVVEQTQEIRNRSNGTVLSGLAGEL